jgi:pimeloyl-ACP methyl ester carboxylesterase
VTLHFVTGWAGDAAQYPRLAAAGPMLRPFVDFAPAELPGLLPARGETLVAWSTGAHLVLAHAAQLLPRFGLVLLLAPFLRFTDSFPQRTVLAMLTSLEEDPARTLAAFHANCGPISEEAAPPPFRPEQLPALAAGLRYLASAPAALAAPVPAPNAVLVRGARDRIVRARAVQALLPLLPGATVAAPECGHKIPQPVVLELLHARLGTLDL